MRAELLLGGILVIAAYAPVASTAQTAGPPFIRTAPHHASRQQFLKEVERAIAMESSASQTLLRRTRNSTVRSLAGRLAAHARILSAGLKALAIEANSQTPPAMLNASQRQTLDSLKHIPVSNLDARYVASMRGLYEEVLQQLKAYSENGPNGPARDFARQIIPRAKQNLSAIRRVQDQI